MNRSRIGTCACAFTALCLGSAAARAVTARLLVEVQPKAARAEVTLGDVTVSSDTTWTEDVYNVDNLTVSTGATLTIAGGSTINASAKITIAAGGKVLLQAKNTSGAVDGKWHGVGVTINALNLQVDTGGTISTDGQGYEGGQGPGAGGSDPGAHGGAGGGYGGIGGLAGDAVNAGGLVYGDAFAPVELGSGGGATSAAAGRGGGAITINVSDTLTLDGIITANGGAGGNVACSLNAAGGGSGGSIFITTATLAGTGTMTASGAAGGSGGCFPTVGDDGGGGAGGRIAVYYQVGDAFTGFTTSSVDGAAGGGHRGAPGTMIFIDSTTNALRISQHLDLAPDSSMRFGAVTVDDAATLVLGGGSTLTVENDFIVTGHATVIAESKNATDQVDGLWQGAGGTINARAVRIDAGSVLSADGQGYPADHGPGAGGADGGVHGGAGGGYGGVGGRAGDDFNTAGMAYGDAFAPVDLGSGGGSTSTAGGRGGGAITLNVSDTLTLDGVITANGAVGGDAPCSQAAAGGGAGGSIFITTATLAGTGSLTANGGSGGVGGCFPTVGDDGGGGAGGRIAVRYQVGGGFTGFTTSSVNGAAGGGHVGAPGTMVFIDTTTNALRISQHLDLAPDSSTSFGAVTVDDAATLVLGGGATLTVANDLVVTGSSSVIVQGKNVASQVNGEWKGAGATIEARNLRVDEGSMISADALGYVGGQGPGVGGSDGGLHRGSGGGYGGVGGRSGDGFNAGGQTYGSAFAPVDLGSGGGVGDSAGGSGGGAIVIRVGDTLTLDGLVIADGAAGASAGCADSPGGGGSGGSIFITTATLAGTGKVRADGGAGGEGGCTGAGDDGGGGAGGRIAVLYAADAGFAGFTTSSVSGGNGGGHLAPPGTLVFLNTESNALRISQHLDFAPDSAVHFGAVTLDDQATLVLGGGVQLTVEGDFDVTQGSTVLIEGKQRTGQIDGRWRGAGATITAGVVRIDGASSISASEQGYLAGVGPGSAGWDGANTAGGGGYGGGGGSGNGPNAGGPTYGKASAPVDLGSGGASAHAAAGVGGGAAAIYSNALLLDGVIVANGGNGSGVGCSGAAPGGGSGGSLLIVTETLSGEGSLHADGGAGGEGGCTGGGDDGGGGGGGRIAVHYTIDEGFAGVTTSSANGGADGPGRAGAPGTLLFIGCAGDCDGNGQVTVDELVLMVNLALDKVGVLACLAGDRDRDAAIVVNEIIIGVNNALAGCPSADLHAGP